MVNPVAVSPAGGTTLVSGSDDKMVRVWRAADGALLRTLEGNTSWVNSSAVNPVSATIVSGYGNKRALLWRTAEGPVASVGTSETPPCKVPVDATPSGTTAAENELGARASSPSAESIANWLQADARCLRGRRGEARRAPRR